ncbi:hypothetical protein [Ramlibacter algicola]|uniref:Transmembrane protein n=1 Tax=Ramlibacter algicola TaxID=2795217 RepID=A0A934USW2_9BURK|nr:hypothetical protein [Ramlibacter algicola]MBK0393907.1 hypothetical protein [Ramlibacter algicola]
MLARKMLWIAWPAFLAACLLQALVFALVDPHDVQWLHGTLAWSRQAVHAVAFFAFWVISMGACALTTLLRLTPNEVNQCPFAPARRPPGCPGQVDVRDA